MGNSVGHVPVDAGAIRLVLLGMGLAIAPPVIAATGPATVIEQALRCELPMGQADTVMTALKRLGAKPGAAGASNGYRLSAPAHPFGLAVTQFSVADDEVQTYIARLPGIRIEDIAKAAKLKPVAGGYGRDTRHGTLLADVRERGEVWLMCTVTQ